MNRLNSLFLRPSPTRSRYVSSDGQSALVDKLEVSPSRSLLFTGPHRYHPGIVQQAQGRSAMTAVSPHHNNQYTAYNLLNMEAIRSSETLISNWTTKRRHRAGDPIDVFTVGRASAFTRSAT
jgi:hypothetical protein